MEKVQNPSNFVCHPPSSEPFRIVRVIRRWAMQREKNTNILVGEFGEKRQLARYRPLCGDNIKMDVKKIGGDLLD
jgi:hypothetical protein